MLQFIYLLYLLELEYLSSPLCQLSHTRIRLFPSCGCSSCYYLQQSLLSQHAQIRSPLTKPMKFWVMTRKLDFSGKLKFHIEIFSGGKAYGEGADQRKLEIEKVNFQRKWCNGFSLFSCFVVLIVFHFLKDLRQSIFYECVMLSWVK